MTAFIQSMEGDDQIRFESGIVNGGEGNDSYFLRRVNWHNNQDELNDNLLELSAVIIENTRSKSSKFRVYVKRNKECQYFW
ncbi:hypothetical protein [Providencia hangzhouensis]|uniref:hypothetical protein n=1 Tax=Providencia hangzhouensis TaxID=3031799 RepID=UPI0034DD4CFE